MHVALVLAKSRINRAWDWSPMVMKVQSELFSTDLVLFLRRRGSVYPKYRKQAQRRQFKPETKYFRNFSTLTTYNVHTTYLVLVRMWSQPALPAVQCLPHHHRQTVYGTENISSAVLKLYLQDSLWLTAFCSPFCLFAFHGPFIPEMYFKNIWSEKVKLACKCVMQNCSLCELQRWRYSQKMTSMSLSLLRKDESASW